MEIQPCLPGHHLDIKPTSMRPRVTVLRYMLVYDGDCGPCTKFKRAIDFLDTRMKLDYLSLIEADEKGVLDSVSPNLRHRSFHLVSPEGTVLSGAKALPGLIGLLPTGRPISLFMVLAPGGLSAMSFVYSVFSRLHDTGSCRYKTDSSVNTIGNRHNSHWHRLEAESPINPFE